MKSFVKSILILDKKEKIHAVKFTEGLNVITGKSSTGKSALIEIFDYCFGASDFTIPHGIITSFAKYYVVIINLGETDLILARTEDSTKAFLKEEKLIDLDVFLENLGSEYFSENYFFALPQFKKHLGLYFGLNITDVDERNLTNKSPTPSVRSFTSFMLQHQNLIANKHSIFYRFDEAEKRAQVIEHFKIFVGFVDQKYFLFKQELDKLNLEHMLLKRRDVVRTGELNEKRELLKKSIEDFNSISENNYELSSNAPLKILLEKIKNIQIQLGVWGTKHAETRQNYLNAKSKKLFDLGNLEQQLRRICSSIESQEKLVQKSNQLPLPSEANLMENSACPFCGTHTNKINEYSEKLGKAIDWLNNEITETHYTISSLEKDRKTTEEKIVALKKEVQDVDAEIEKLDNILEEFRMHRSQYELTLKQKVSLESLVEDLVKISTPIDFSSVISRVEYLQSELKKYQLEQKLKTAEIAINRELKILSSQFEFEKSYRDYQLMFDIATFDLFFKTKDGNKIYLRAMGSGANWLSSHLVLFLSLTRYFCSLGKKCLIPSILFIDQPSQVYFPSILDYDNAFNPKEIKTKLGKNGASVDEDLQAVSNIYSSLATFVNETKRQTGISPQIIVTDHADNLTLDPSLKISFENLVAGRRWRDRGFIDIS